MPRVGREQSGTGIYHVMLRGINRSGTGIYHVMLRGINRQEIFEEPEDYLTFIKILSTVQEDLRM